MPLDGMLVHKLTGELSSVLVGGKIEKIVQPEKNEMCFWIRVSDNNGRHFNKKLYISAQPSDVRMNLTDRDFPTSQAPRAFAMLARKHFLGARIIDITQNGADRVITFTVSVRNDMYDLVEKKIIVELTGKYCNIVFVDENGIVLDALRHVDMEMSQQRLLLPGVIYEYPSVGDKINIFTDDLNDITENNYKSKIAGMSQASLKEVEHLGKALGSINNGIKEYKSRILNTDFKSVYCKDNSGKTDFFVYNYEYLQDNEITECNSVSELLEEVAQIKGSAKNNSELYSALSKTIKTHISRVDKKICALQSDIARAEKNEIYRNYGDILAANIYRIKKGMDKIDCEDFATGETITIPLDTHMHPSKNIERYYKLYAKAKRTKVAVTEQLDLAGKEQEYLAGQLYNIENVQTTDEFDEITSELASLGYLKGKYIKNGRQSKKRISKHEEYVTSDGYTLLVGKNNKQNDHLTHTIAQGYDIWFHAKDMPGSHVILKNSKKEFPDNAVVEAASLAAYFSSQREQYKVSVDYCFVKNVKKVPGTMSGFVTYDNYYTVIVDGTNKIFKKITKKSKNDL